MNRSDERARGDALRRYDILDTPPEPNFDRITRIASTALRRPVSTLSLADRERYWFKSRQGVAASEMPRNMAFCEETIGGDAVFVVNDAFEDPRFAGAPAVKGAPHFRFYAGAPLVTPAGVRIGSLCVLDTVPGAGLSPDESRTLTDLASTAVELLEARARQIELSRRAAETAHLARHDPLTGLPNRRWLEESHDELRDQDDGSGVALLYLDLDGFKGINDRRGHACGDALLRQVAARIRSSMPSEACAARIGGDEFAVLLPAPTELLRGEATALARRLVERIGQPYDDVPPGVRIGCSAGIALAGGRTALPQLLSRADAALYRAKHRGGAQTVLAE